MSMDIDDAPVAMASGPAQTGATWVPNPLPARLHPLTSVQNPLLQLRCPH